MSDLLISRPVKHVTYKTFLDCMLPLLGLSVCPSMSEPNIYTLCQQLSVDYNGNTEGLLVVNGK